jgi:TonB family protein
MRIRGRSTVAFALPLALGLCAVPAAWAGQTEPVAAEAFSVSRWVRPDYPQDAIDHDVTGDVDIDLSIAPDGTLVSARAVSGPQVLHADAEKAARLWRFERRTDGRVPTRPVGLQVTFSFTQEYGGHYATLALSARVPPHKAAVSLSEAETEDATAKGAPEPQSDRMPSTGPGARGEGMGSGEGVRTGRGSGTPISVGPGSAAASAPASPPPNPIAMKARMLNAPRPGYTEQAHQNRTTGAVTLNVLFGADGTVKHVSVIRGLPDGLNAKAVEAAQEIKFEPARDAGGNPVDSLVVLAVTFTLR